VKLGVDRALVGDVWVDGDVRIEDGRIVEVGIGRRGTAGLVAAPGFVDVQINGFAGVDFRTATVEELLNAADLLAGTGTTAFLPTLYSLPPEGYVAALEGIEAAQDEQEQRGVGGAWIGGAHLEGPFLAKRWAGAHQRHHLLDPDLEVLRMLLDAGPIHLVTLAPELPGADSAIRALCDEGVVVAMGHTDADAAECHRAIDAGVSMLTHCWNAHRRFGPRDPGPAGVGLDRVAVGVICDGVHLADETLRLTFAAGGERVCVVSDAIAPCGTSGSAWQADGVEVTIADGRATLPDGTLAGAVAPMDQAIRHLVEIGIPLEQALYAAASAPASVLGELVILRAGSVADVVILEEDEVVVQRTLIGGRVVAER